LLGHLPRFFALVAVAVTLGAKRIHPLIVFLAGVVPEPSNFGQQVEVLADDGVPSGGMLVQEKAQHGVQVLLKVAVIEMPEHPPKAGGIRIPVVVSAPEAGRQGARQAGDRSSCRHCGSLSKSAVLFAKPS